MLDSLKAGAVVCNIGHFDTEIDTNYLRGYKWVEVKPQVQPSVSFRKRKRLLNPSF